jgi:hypothetical protein
VSLRVVLGVEDGQENQTECTGNGEEDREDGAQLVEPAPVGHELTSMTKPALSQKGQVQEDDGDDATGDEEGFQARGANVGNVSVIASVAARQRVKVMHTQWSGRLPPVYKPVCLLWPMWRAWQSAWLTHPIRSGGRRSRQGVLTNPHARRNERENPERDDPHLLR